MKKTHSTKPHADEHHRHHCKFFSSACSGSMTLESLQKALCIDVGYMPHLGDIDFAASGATLSPNINTAQRRRVEQLRTYLETPPYRAALQHVAEAVRYSNDSLGVRDIPSTE